MPYPEIKPNATFRLEVGDRHSLYVEESGNEAGLPVVFLHGGPGAGCDALHRRFFDPNAYRIVLFDQRGAGRSRPHAELNANDTWALVADIERIREHLGIERWVVFGGSWGSTLALAYAETHPDRVLALVLRGIFLCSRDEIQWFYQRGANRLFPDAWEDYERVIPAAERADMVAAYHRRLTGDDELARMAAAKAWSQWEARLATLLPNRAIVDHFAAPHTALALSRIECHYFMNDAFLRENQLIADAGRLAGIPGVIVHGRYDVICPLENAWTLHRAWPDSELQIIADAGHAVSETGITRALVAATNRFAAQFGAA